MFSRLIAVSLLAALAAVPAFAAVVTWTGGGGNALWNNAANWNPTQVPGSADDALFNTNAGSLAAPITDTPGLVKSLTITAGADVYLRANVVATTFTAATGLIVNTGSELHLMDGNAFAVDLNVDVDASTLLVHPGGTLTITGALHVQGAAAKFGAFEDGTDAATPLLLATINYGGNAQFDVTGSLLLGEGQHNFGSLVDVGFTANVANVVVPAQRADNDTVAEIHLINNHPTQEIKFNAAGSMFFINSVGAGTRVTQTGRMILIGTFDVSNATAGTAFTAWVASAPVQVGDLSRVLAADILTANGRVDWGAVTVVEPSAATISLASDGPRISLRSASSGKFVFDSLTIEGDTYNHFNNQNENNAPQLSVQGTLEVTNDLIVEDGAEGGDAVGTGGGGTLIVRGGSIKTNNLQIGDMAADEDTEGANFIADSASSFDLSNGIFQVQAHTTSSVNACTFTGSGTVNFSVSSNAAAFELLHSTVTAASAGGLVCVLGSQQLRVLDTVFSNYNAPGIQFGMGTILSRLSQNHFLQGQSGGTHMTFYGLGNATKLNCDNNLFDGSTAPYSGGNAGKGIVTQAFTPNLITFRASGSDYGEGSFVLSRATCEAQDDDNGSSDPTQVSWQENVNTLSIAPLTFPNQIEGAITDGLGNQSAMLFTLQGIGGAAIINSIRINFDGLTGDVTAADIGYVTLFHDDDSNGLYDNGESFSGPGGDTADEAMSGPSILFDMAAKSVPAANRTIAASSVARWGIAITFLAAGSGHGGQLRVRIEIGEIEDANANIVVGLPIQNVLEVTGPVNTILVVQQPTVTPKDTVITPSPVVELRDLANRPVRARVYNVTASIQQGPSGAALAGTLTAASSKLNAQATFANLRLSHAGANYILRFSAQGKNGDSTVFEITGVNPPGPGPLGGGGGGGGCSATSQGLPWLLLALPLLFWRRRRRAS